MRFDRLWQTISKNRQSIRYAESETLLVTVKDPLIL